MSNVVFEKDRLLVDGEPKILLCASLFYFRIPREDWETRMKQLRSCGYNCIDVYFPWNFHELHPDDWRFEGMHDADAFLTLAAENDLYVIARPGPYICSEWDGGALPGWIKDVCSELRQDDEEYLAYLYRWLGKILPIIAKHQSGENGSVVAVQLENELDFFGCRSPKNYLEKLVAFAKGQGITVPLIACAGECDVQGAGGEADGINPSFNEYTPDRFPYLEAQCLHMRKLAAKKDGPLLITETNRENDYLKRQISVGARLVAPYNQVGGTDMEMTNGISNWASDTQHPLALMATDYDFHSMLTVDGRFRQETIRGRNLGTMLASFGAHLASAQTAWRPDAVNADFRLPLLIDERSGRETPCVPAAQMDCGELLFVTNTGESAGLLTLSAQLGVPELAPVQVASGETLALPARLTLAPWGEADVRVEAASAELVAITRENGALSLTFAGAPNAQAVVSVAGSMTVTSGKAWTQVTATVRCRVLSPEEAAHEPFPGMPDLPATIPSLIDTVNAGEKLQTAAACSRSAASPLGNQAKPMEDYGIYRGDIFYEFDLPEACRLLLKNAADMVWVNDAAFFGDGSTYEATGRAGTNRIRVHAWGHPNFDDVRQPSLKMGSKKGLADLCALRDCRDISSLWFIYPEGKYVRQQNAGLKATDRILATTIDSWSYPVTPMRAEFVKTVLIPETDSDRFYLRFGNTSAAISVTVNGIDCGQCAKCDRTVEITRSVRPGESAEIHLTVERTFSHDALGGVELLCAKAVTNVRASGLDAADWKQVREAAEKQPTALPLRVAVGQERVLSGLETDGPAMLVIDGNGLFAVLLNDDHVIGTVQLTAPGYPEVRGGSSRRIYVPASYQTRSLRLYLCGIGDGGTLTGLHWEIIR